MAIPRKVREARRRAVDGELMHAGTNSVRSNGGSSLSGVLPASWCRTYGVESTDNLETYVDWQSGIVIHALPEELDAEHGGGGDGND